MKIVENRPQALRNLLIFREILMMKLKYVLWALLIAFFGMLIYQNQGVFLAQYSLDINLGFSRYHIPELYVVVMMAIFFFAGLLTAYAAGLFARYRAHKTVRSLKQTIDSYSGTIATLKHEVEGLKPQTQSALELQEEASQTAAPSETEPTPT